MIDTPPVLAMADTAVLCPLVEGVALVVGAEQSTRPAVHRALDQIRGVSGRLLGVILNKVDLRREGYHTYYYQQQYYRSYFEDEGAEDRHAPLAGSGVARDGWSLPGASGRCAPVPSAECRVPSAEDEEKGG